MLFGKEPQADKSSVSPPRRRRRGNILEEAFLGLDRPNRSPRPPGPTLTERWHAFKGTDSSASVVFGCTSVITTVILVTATVWLTLRANELQDRQNELILNSSLPAVSASLLLMGNGEYTLTVENSGPRANFRSIEPMTLLRFTFEKHDGDMEDGYIAVYDVFQEVEPNQVETGTVASVASVPRVSSMAEEVCATIVSADPRIGACSLEVSLIIQYQTKPILMRFI